MAYTFKKLSDVGQLNKPTEQTHVLVEDNSEIKKILVDNLGGGTVKSVNKLAPDENGNINIEFPSYTVNGAAADENGNFEIEIPECAIKSVNGVEPDENGNIEIEVSGGGASVQPDLNQNDPTAPDYVKNRTHYAEAGIKITWDGDTTNIETVVQEGLYLVSEETPSNDELKNSAIQVTIVDANGDILQKVDGSESQIWEMLEAEGMITDDVAYLSYAAVVRKDNANIMGELVFPKAGTYFAKMPEDDVIQFISMLDTGEKVKKIDSKFLPDFDPNTISHLLVGVQGQGENAEIFNDIEGNTASGDYSHAEGHDTHAIGRYSHAEGIETFAYGEYSHAEGGNNYVTANIDLSGVAGTTVYTSQTDLKVGSVLAHNDVYAIITDVVHDPETGVYNVTLNKTLSGYSEMVNVTVKLYDHVASGNYAHVEGHRNLALGESSHAEGVYTTASGSCSHTEGNGTKATGSYSHAEGSGTEATGNQSHAEGSQTKSIGNYSHTEGYLTSASGLQAHAEGNWTGAGGESSHAEGQYSEASGRCSHAEGYYTKASESCSHAEGDRTKASGNSSHAEGYYTEAIGPSSHAEGMNTIASGNQSHAEGWHTIATGWRSHVQGRYNIEDTEDKYAHIVGNGESEENRSNAHTLDWYGNAWYANSVAAKYFVLESPDGSLFKITVDNSGTLSAEAMPE